LLWDGTAGSYLDLGQFLPGGFTGSFAEGISANGDIVGDAMDASGNFHAFLWASVPEPATLSLLSLGGLTLIRRRR
jgi:probable HAF family extracellular repeat protein